MRPTHRIIELRAVVDERGSLSFAQSPDDIPFQPKRIFMLYGIKAGESRGHHAHREQHQYLIMMHGRARVEIDDGAEKFVVDLSRPSQALHIPPMLWLRLDNFSSDAVCAVLASDVYTESDYIRDYNAFLAMASP